MSYDDSVLRDGRILSRHGALVGQNVGYLKIHVARIRYVCYKEVNNNLGDAKMTAYAYIRISKATEQGLGLDAQRSAIERYCRDHGLELTQVFVDNDVSGGLELEKRPELQRAVNTMRKGDTLLIAKRDRLARDTAHVAPIEKVLQKKGCSIISCLEHCNGIDANSTLMRHMLDVFAEHERNTIRDRTKAALAEKKTKGERTGHVPFGHKLAADGVHLEICPLEQDILCQMRNLQREGLSIRKIAEELNRRQAFNRNGTIWTKSAIHRVMANAA